MSANGSNRIGLEMEALDLLFFRDGRPMEPGYLPDSGMPNPQVMTGAVQTFLLRRHDADFKRLGQAIRDGASLESAFEQAGAPADIARVEIRGPWFALLPRSDETSPKPLFPVPANLVKSGMKDRIIRLDPLSPNTKIPGRLPVPEGCRPLWSRSRDRLEDLEGFVTLEGMVQFLSGKVPGPEDVLSNDQGSLYKLCRRTGIVIDPDRLGTEEGKIYGIGLLELNPELVHKGAKHRVGLYAEVNLPDSLRTSIADEWQPMSLGGEGRRVRVRPSPHQVAWPRQAASDSQGASIVLIVPGFSVDGWRPENLKPVAAAVPGSHPVSGWDMARGGPKPTRFGMPAGSVYFFDHPPDIAGDSICAGEDARCGWGQFLQGVFNYV